MEGAGGGVSWGVVRGRQESLAVWEGAGRVHSEQGFALAAGGVSNRSGPSLGKWANASRQVNSMLNGSTDEHLQSVEWCV